MGKWICEVCGYTHQGEEPPEFCPKCGAPKSRFYSKGNVKGCAYGFLFLLLILAAIIYGISSCSSTLTVDNSVVKSIDLNRYLGRWYEIARFDHRFERNLTHCTATYQLQSDGTIKVTNQGMKKGKSHTSTGKAKLTDEAGVLRVSFFGPFYSDYRILMLAQDYSYALIGGSSDNYLWILSRSPEIDDDTRAMIINEAIRRGYDTTNLIWVEQHTTVQSG